MFVIDKNNPELGIGKAKWDGSGFGIEYFCSPSLPPVEKAYVPTDQAKGRLIGHHLQTQTKVYVQENNTWRCGRVMTYWEGKKQYKVRFQNKNDQFIEATKLFVRWDLPLLQTGNEGVYANLANFLTETPLYYKSRAALRKHILAQRSLARGLNAYNGASIELVPYQFYTTLQILLDPVQRYLLASEVGLGKTIVSAAVLAQHRQDNPTDSKILIVVPKSLVGQWKGELQSKFYLSSTEKHYKICTHQAFVANPSQGRSDWTYICIDEAHHLANMAFESAKQEQYLQIAKVCHQCPRLLLLSATPVQRNEDGFLGMLHLLDPQRHPLSSRQAFHQKVKRLTEISNICYLLANPDDVDDLIEDLEDLEDLSADFGDTFLSEIISVFLRQLEGKEEISDEDRKLVQRIFDHIIEEYQLHRRILRTHRGKETTDYIQQEREQPFVHPQTSDSSAMNLEMFFDDWRESVSATDDTAIADTEAIFAAVISDPQVLQELLRKRLTKSTSQSEIDCINHALPGLITHPFVKNRTRKICEVIQANPKTKYWIVFCNEPSTGNRIYQHLQGFAQDYTKLPVYRHGDEKWRRVFQGGILICDRTAEEGLNLQAKGQIAIVHYDLLLNPNRLEQRIGRVDRFGNLHFQSHLFQPTESVYIPRLIDLYQNTIEIFTRSAANLQYLITEAQKHFDLYQHGIDAFTDINEFLLTSVKGKSRIEKTRQEIRNQEIMARDLRKGFLTQQDHFAHLDASDQASGDDLFGSLTTWLTQMQFNIYQQEPHQVFTPREERVLLSIYQLQRLGLEKVLCNTNRTRAKGDVQLSRYGSPFINNIEKWLEWDDRGRVFLLGAIEPSYDGPPKVFLLFDLSIHVDIRFITETIAAWSAQYDLSVDESSIQRMCDTWLPPQDEKIILCEDYSEFSQSLQDEDNRTIFENYFEDDYFITDIPKYTPSEGYGDINLRRQRIDTMRERTELPEHLKEIFEENNWHDFVITGAATAEQLVGERYLASPKVETAKRRLTEKITELKDKLQTANQADQRWFELNLLLAEGCLKGIYKPAIKMDACGGILYSNTNYWGNGA